MFNILKILNTFWENNNKINANKQVIFKNIPEGTWAEVVILSM